MVVALAGLLRWRRPAWYWLTFGVTLATLRVLVRYGSVMEACGLTVPPPRWRLAIARMANRPAPESRAPRILRLRPTRTGLVLRLGLRPGQDAFDVAASCDRLRHSFAMYGVTSREIRSGVVELRMTGYDVLARVQMPAKVDRVPMRVPVALREDGAVHYRDYHTTPHALTVGATQSGKSVYQRNLVAELAAQDVALVGIDCKQGVELFPLARRFSALADNPDTAADLLDALVTHMEGVYQLIRADQRITADIPDAEIAADIWDLPTHLRPTPIVLLVDEVAELALFATKHPRPGPRRPGGTGPAHGPAHARHRARPRRRRHHRRPGRRRGPGLDAPGGRRHRGLGRRVRARHPLADLLRAQAPLTGPRGGLNRQVLPAPGAVALPEPNDPEGTPIMAQPTTPAVRVCSNCDGFPTVRVTLGGRDRHGNLRTITVHCPACHGTGTRPARRPIPAHIEVAA